MVKINRSGIKTPGEYIGTETERTEKIDNVIGDVFYVTSGSGKLTNASIWNGSSWDLFEVYNV